MVSQSGKHMGIWPFFYSSLSYTLFQKKKNPESKTKTIQNSPACPPFRKINKINILLTSKKLLSIL